MIKDVVMVASTSTVREVNHILEKFTFKAFPFVDSKGFKLFTFFYLFLFTPTFCMSGKLMTLNIQPFTPHHSFIKKIIL